MNLKILFNKIFRRREWEKMLSQVVTDKDGNGVSMSIGLDIPVNEIIAREFARFLERNKAQNFVTMSVVNPETLKRYTITVQRASGVTPAERITQLETALKEADEILQLWECEGTLDLNNEGEIDLWNVIRRGLGKEEIK